MPAIPPSLTGVLRVRSTDIRLPPLRVGQRLQVLVEEKRPGGLLLNVLGRSMKAQTRLPLSPGERLTVQVQTTQPQLTLKIIPPETPQTPVKALMARLLPKQDALAPAMRRIAGTGGEAAARLPEAARQQLTRLVETLPTSREASEPGGLRGLLARSGVFLERLLPTADPETANALAGTDRKALLQRFAALLRASLQQQSPTNRTNAGATTRGQGTPKDQTAARPGGQAAAQTTQALEALLGHVESALSRIRLLQMQPTVSHSRLDLAVEVPLRDGADLDNLYLRIRRDDDDEGTGTEERATTPVPAYQLVVRLDFEHHGAAQATLRLQGERVSAVWHSPNPALSTLIERHLPELGARIRALGLEADSLVSVNAEPPRSPDDVRAPPSGLLDEQA